MEGAGDDASEMGEIGGMLDVCSLRSFPVLFERLSCGGGTTGLLLLPSSSTRVTELRLLRGESTLDLSSALEGKRGTGGTDDGRELPRDPELVCRSRRDA